MKELEIKKDDVLKAVYFIIALTQNQSRCSMQGALSSKGDLMGGIFDRWINIIPENIVFNKMILPDISNEKNTEVISDFYLYDPKISGIAPDVIGIKTDSRVIPFAVYKDKWTPVPGMPQIEVKTFKKPQKMISLRNQRYDEKYLVMTESEFKIDYLLPFFSKEIFSDEIYGQLHMDDSAFIISNTDGNMQQTGKVRISDDILGTVTLLKVTNAKSFMESSNFCEGNVSVQYLTSITEKSRKPSGILNDEPLSRFCSKTACGLYRFNNDWYDGITYEGIPYYSKKTKSGNIEYLYRTLDISSNDIDSLRILKKSVSSLYIKAVQDTSINEIPLEKDKVYRIEFQFLDRSGNSGEEYFMQKNLIHYVPDCEETLKNILKKIIDGGGQI